MIGACAPAAQALDHLDAVDVGQAEVEDDDVGRMPRGGGQRRPTVGGQRRPRSRALAG